VPFRAPERQLGRSVLVTGDQEIAARAGVGIATIYRHFPTRADLVVAVYRHQVQACAEAGPALLASASSPLAALHQWVDLFVDFLVTKHGLANALRSDSSGFEVLHDYLLDRLVPVCAQLLDAAVKAGEIRSGTGPYELMRGIGNLCIGRDGDPHYDPRRLVEVLMRGLQRPQSSRDCQAVRSHQLSTLSARRVFQRLGVPSAPSRSKWTRPG